MTRLVNRQRARRYRFTIRPYGLGGYVESDPTFRASDLSFRYEVQNLGPLSIYQSIVT